MVQKPVTDVTDHQEAQALEGRKVQKILELGLEEMGIYFQEMVLSQKQRKCLANRLREVVCCYGRKHKTDLGALCIPISWNYPCLLHGRGTKRYAFPVDAERDTSEFVQRKETLSQWSSKRTV